MRAQPNHRRMSQRIIITLTCDVCQAPSATKVRLSLGKKEYEADLCSKHVEVVAEALAPIVAAGRRIKRKPMQAAESPEPPRPSKHVPGFMDWYHDDESTIREWAKARGMAVKDRGRLAQVVRSAYAVTMTRQHQQTPDVWPWLRTECG